VIEYDCLDLQVTTNYIHFLASSNSLWPVFIIKSYIQDRFKYDLTKSRTNQKVAVAS